MTWHSLFSRREADLNLSVADSAGSGKVLSSENGAVFVAFECRPYRAPCVPYPAASEGGNGGEAGSAFMGAWRKLQKLLLSLE